MKKEYKEMISNYTNIMNMLIHNRLAVGPTPINKLCETTSPEFKNVADTFLNLV